ncbi:3-phosphoshikimate 1-carboxyvinyltransferase [Pedobacter africanus]|uniref:3-phosphoshikimate 1-carboxyvinyltransferase n=1 Tax=Pedobacter africanus TaxID=151894 RepID=A0A1W2E216_9SPHI|nr:3-phosphoshikimate 1-carboxyvinyltransferase [Pedobacter africanus]SMD03088.1 3-phosphoshikimate 1-carboxyvinyltransferase [Pedobacter africanus]
MSKNAIVSFKGNKDINAEIALTGSKSESNRALIISALSGGLVSVDNLSDAVDTVTLNNILKAIREENDPDTFFSVDVGHAGTAMRFLTAYLTITRGMFHLTGSGRMKERPIKLLVEALRELGAEIRYAGQEGFPPLDISKHFAQSSRKVKIAGNISSQYLSALLMIAPSLPLGLSLEIEGELTSRPYLEMTLSMLEEAGIGYKWEEQTIHIDHQPFKTCNLIVEPDWSAASYWYSIVALADHGNISLPHLKEKSLQGDSRIREIMVPFGVRTSQTANGIALKSGTSIAINEVLNLKDCPDLAQTIIVCAAAKGLNLSFTGLETLKIKETNRVLALQQELAKIGVTLAENNEVYTLNCSQLSFPEKVIFATYDDHRMAMAFAPLSLFIKEVEMEDYQVVEKSYPDFWKDLEKAGFTVKEI